jgi:hypothetical protein
MPDENADQSINIGSVHGIGNVIRHNSSSHIEINIFTINRILLDDRKTVLQRNPNFIANIGRALGNVAEQKVRKGDENRL